MLKFFRNLRQNIIIEKSTSKRTSNLARYLIYAIGEIALVMIGILLALQVNNWNEERKLNKIELNQLKEIRSNLEQSLVELKKGLDLNKKSIELHRSILHHVTNDLPYDNSLDSAFLRFTNWVSPYLAYNAYETLKSMGIDIIQNDSIKYKIINLFENVFVTLVNDYDKSEWNLDQIVVTPFAAKNIRYFSDGKFYSAKPNDFEKLKKDEEFINILNLIILRRSSGVNRFENTIGDVNQLLIMIDNELNNRNG